MIMKNLGLILIVIMGLGSCIANAATPVTEVLVNSTSYQRDLEKLEHRFDGKIGVYAINTNNNQVIAYRADKRFPMQSTVKFIGVSALLHQANANEKLLNEKIHESEDDLSPWHPITGKYINRDISLKELSAAAISYSDNPAINYIIKKLGGPKYITEFAHSIGNQSFNLLHYEGQLNSNPNFTDDTVTPKDMALSIEKITLGNVLTKPLKSELISWMTNSTTSYKRIRSGVSIGWVVADKTGSGDFGVANDVGIVWSPACKPVVLSIYTAGSSKYAKSRDDIVAAITEIVLNAFSKTDDCFNALS